MLDQHHVLTASGAVVDGVMRLNQKLFDRKLKKKKYMDQLLLPFMLPVSDFFFWCEFYNWKTFCKPLGNGHERCKSLRSIPSSKIPDYRPCMSTVLIVTTYREFCTNFIKKERVTYATDAHDTST